MYYRYKNNNNKDDISYSFSLESYIDSLNNDYSFNDYKIKVNNKTYDELSIEHNRLHNEINKLMNEDFNKYSEEDLKDNLFKFWNFLKNLWNKLCLLLDTFIKSIIAKIYEWSLKFRSKQDLFHKFQSKIFTDINIQIKDKKLNPKIIEDIDKYIKMIDNWNNNFQYVFYFDPYIKNIHYKEDHDENQFLKNMSTILNRLKKDGIDSYINNIFYSENKKSETTIREYFGCNVGETPKAIIILSDEYTKRLVDIKNKTEKFLKIIKDNGNKIFQYQYSSKWDNEKSDEFNVEQINNMKNIIKNISLFYNMNYTFFIKSLNIRSKVAKYILKGSLGNLFEDNLNKNNDENNITKTQIKKYHNIPYEIYREIPNVIYDVELDKKNKAKVVINPFSKSIIIGMSLEINGIWYNKFLNYSKKYLIGGDQSSITETRKNFPNPDYSDNYIKFRQNNDHLFLFKEIQNLFEIPIDITKQTTLKFMEPFNKISIKDIDFKINFYIQMVISNERHQITDSDKFYHTEPEKKSKVKNQLLGFWRNNYLFTEQRVYGGLGQPMTYGGMTKNIDKGKNKIFLVSLKSGEYIYKDPEFSPGRFQCKKTASFIETDKVEVTDITDLVIFYGELKFYKSHSEDALRPTGPYSSLYTKKTDPGKYFYEDGTEFIPRSN